jgi:hypothetical protein
MFLKLTAVVAAVNKFFSILSTEGIVDMGKFGEAASIP